MEFMEPMTQHGLKPFGIPLMLKAHDAVINIPNQGGFPIEARLEACSNPKSRT